MRVKNQADNSNQTSKQMPCSNRIRPKNGIKAIYVNSYIDLEKMGIFFKKATN